MIAEKMLAYIVPELISQHADYTGQTFPIYPHVAPQTQDYPFFTYDILSTDIDSHANFTARSDMQLTTVIADIQIWSDSISERGGLVDAFRDQFHGQHNAQWLTSPSVYVRDSFVENVSTFSENDISGSDAQIYRASISLKFTFNWS